jgi:hypothetical protein
VVSLLEKLDHRDLLSYGGVALAALGLSTFASRRRAKLQALVDDSFRFRFRWCGGGTRLVRFSFSPLPLMDWGHER